jgi:hypothetical protein
MGLVHRLPMLLDLHASSKNLLSGALILLVACAQCSAKRDTALRNDACLGVLNEQLDEWAASRAMLLAGAALQVLEHRLVGLAEREGARRSRTLKKVRQKAIHSLGARLSRVTTSHGFEANLLHGMLVALLLEALVTKVKVWALDRIRTVVTHICGADLRGARVANAF